MRRSIWCVAARLDVRAPLLLWLAVLVAHLWPIAYAFTGAVPHGLGDPAVYWTWLHEARQSGEWPILDIGWVYPPAALYVTLPLLMVPSETLAALSWVGLALACNLVVLVVLDGRGRGRLVSWWWVGFVGLTGALAVSRLESITMAMTMVSLVLVAGRPGVSAALMTFAGWVKIAPFMWLLPLVTLRPKHARVAISAAALTSAAILVPLLVLGSGTRVLSFLTSQSDRHLQMESPWALPLQLSRLFGGTAAPVYSDTLETYEYLGSGARGLASMADVALYVLVALTAGLIVRVSWIRRKVSDARDETDLLAASGLALTAALILGNKVGSPQYVLWLAPAIGYQLLAGSDRWVATRWAWWGLALALVTQIQYPMMFRSVVEGGLIGTGALVIRYAITLGLFISALLLLGRAARTSGEVLAAEPA